MNGGTSHMKVTKYEHACLVVEENGEQLIIDPGVLSTSFVEPSNPVAIVITHVHADHVDKELVLQLMETHQNLTVFTIADVAGELGAGSQIQVINSHESVQVGNFHLSFWGTDHAIIHPEGARFKNTGVLVNDILYYGGDALDVPDMPVKVLAVPSGGPWLKIEEAIDYMVAVKPERVFPTHDAVLSPVGATFAHSWLQEFAGKHNIGFDCLAVGQSIEI